MACGSVTLIGAGPGDPGLLTLAGREALEQAQVVLYDRLAGEELLTLAPADAQRIDVGKASGNHTLPQEEINRLLLQLALEGKRVVRLKGGDPFLFGRGAEELALLAERGVPFRVIPGVSAALAAPAAAGIPVTHRELAHSVHILTAHGKAGADPEIPFKQLAKLGGTLVFLMGVAALEELAAGLLAAGMAPDTPAALVERGTLPGQRQVDGTLERIAARARELEVRPPAVLVVGAVCALAQRLGPPSNRHPVLCAGTGDTASRLARSLRQRGREAQVWEAVRTLPLEIRDLLERVRDSAWIALTSPVGARLFLEGLWAAGGDARQLQGTQIAAVGPATAACLAERGLRADLVPAIHDGEHLARALCERVRPGERVLLLRARDGTPTLPEILREQDVSFVDMALYHTEALPLPEELAGRVLRGEFAQIAFTSPSSVESFARGLTGNDLSGLEAVCIGESTAAAAWAMSMKVTVAASATVESLVDAILAEDTVTDREGERI